MAALFIYSLYLNWTSRKDNLHHLYQVLIGSSRVLNKQINWPNEQMNEWLRSNNKMWQRSLLQFWWRNDSRQDHMTGQPLDLLLSWFTSSWQERYLWIGWSGSNSKTPIKINKNRWDFNRDSCNRLCPLTTKGIPIGTHCYASRIPSNFHSILVVEWTR